MTTIDWKKASSFDTAETSPGFLLWQVSSIWRRKVESVLSTLHLTHPQFVLLAGIGWLTRNNTEITQVALAKHCNTNITMTSQILRSLEERGYIKRTKQIGNEKSKFPQLTEKGTLIIKNALPLVEEVDKKFFGKLDQDISQCVKMLQKLSQPEN